jgi:hypothetical protein
VYRQNEKKIQGSSAAQELFLPEGETEDRQEAAEGAPVNNASPLRLF